MTATPTAVAGDQPAPLRTSYIDIYWVHMWDRHTPAEETMRALDDEVRAGKILYVGISDTPAWLTARANTLAAWRGWTAFAGLQAPYSLLRRDIERELLPMAEALGMTVAAWSPLAAVQDVAGDLGVMPAQASIAWTRAQSPAVHPIIGARRLDQLLDNLGAAGLGLPPEALARLEAATGIDLGFPATFITETSPLGLRRSRTPRHLA
jgi:aryl-alcohol dehydrogenase-like predicted oxidoreductase